MSFLTPMQLAKAQAEAEGFQYGPQPELNNANISTQASEGNPLVPVPSPVPYYPSSETPNLQLTTEDMSSSLANNFVALDALFANYSENSFSVLYSVVSPTVYEITLPLGYVSISTGPINGGGGYIVLLKAGEIGPNSGAAITDGALNGNSVSLGQPAQNEEDVHTGILLQASPSLDTVVSNGTQTWRFSASSGNLQGVGSAGIVGTQLLTYTVASLPVATAGAIAYASNGRKVGEGAGSGTGVPVYYSNSEWRVYSTDAQVQA